MEPIELLVKNLQDLISQEGTRPIEDIGYDIVAQIIVANPEDSGFYQPDQLIQEMHDLAADLEISNGTKQQLVEMWERLKELTQKLAVEVARGAHRPGKEGARFEFWDETVHYLLLQIDEAEDMGINRLVDGTTEDQKEGDFIAYDVANKLGHGISDRWLTKEEEPLLWQLYTIAKELDSNSHDRDAWEKLFAVSEELKTQIYSA